MGLCKDCKWWDTSTFYVEGSAPHEYGACELAETDGGTPQHPDALGQAVDLCLEHTARLETRWDFGCNQFEAKEAS